MIELSSVMYGLAVGVAALIMRVAMRVATNANGERSQGWMLIRVPSDEVTRVCGIQLLPLKFTLNTLAIRSIANKGKNGTNPFNEL
jgi:hypothetical protein